MEMKIPIFKYTSYGNNFVIIDEISQQYLSEAEKSRFAYYATNINFGVGCDNFLVIQSCTLENLEIINKSRHYWQNLPPAGSAEYIFRMFESDGEEAYSCGNGLLCFADYFQRKFGLENARILTQIPTTNPKVVTIGSKIGKNRTWVNLGHPVKIPNENAKSSVRGSFNEEIDVIEDINIKFRSSDLASVTKQTELNISGYLVFTGEPHFVVFTESGLSIKELADFFFISPQDAQKKSGKSEKRASFGKWLVHHIGSYLNKKYPHYFPSGININFVRLIQNGSTIIEYRCFERGINHETLACGTGAFAVASVVRNLEITKSNDITVWPHLCRCYEPEAQIRIEKKENGWVIHGRPTMLFQGDFLHGDLQYVQKNTGALISSSANTEKNTIG
jgi:diaminopimelate epimerase